MGGRLVHPGRGLPADALRIITNIFTNRTERARAIGLWGGVFGLSLALGPVIGGLLVSAVGWRGVFWVNLPVGAVAIGLTLRYVPESKAASPSRVDLPGQSLVAVVIAALVFAIIEAPGRGWTAAPFSGALVIAVCAFAAVGGYLLLLTIYLQEVRDYAPLRAGLTGLPMAVPAAICAPPSGRIVAARGPRLPLLIAGTCITAGGLALTGLSGRSSPELIAGSLLVFGVGFGSVSAPASLAVVSGMPASHAGTAAALASTGRQVGMSLGVAVIGSAAASALTGPILAEFAPASHVGWWLVAACGLAVLAAGLFGTGGRA